MLGWGWLPVGVLLVLGAVAGTAVGSRGVNARPAVAVGAVAAVMAWAGANAVVAAELPVRNAVGSAVQLAGVARSDSAPGVDGPTEGLWRVELAVARVDGAATNATVVVWGGEDFSEVTRGDRLVLRGKLHASSGRAAAVVWEPRIEEQLQAVGMDAFIGGLRAGLRTATADLPQRLQPLTRGMVIGDDSGMSREQREQLAVSGLTHLTAVSGSHFAIVLVTVTAGLRLVMRRRRVAAALTGLAMGLLVCIVFPEPSVVRAATMAAAVCAALWWGRPAQALPALCGGVAAMAILDPRLTCEPGFAMSVAAVAAITLWAPSLALRIARTVPAALAHPLAVCLAAQAVVLPLLALIGGGVGPWSVAANLAVGWSAAPVTLLGLAALAVAPLCAPLAHAFATAAGWCAVPVDAAARAASSLPGAQLVVPPGAVGAGASAIAVLCCIALTFATRVRLGVLVMAAVCVVAALAVPIVPRLAVHRTPGDWLVVACDVGQADAMLLRSGPRSAVMIDVGAEGGAAEECLRRYGVERIDLLVITHPHADHDGGLPQVLAHYPVTQIWVTAVDPRAGEAAIANGSIPVTTATAGTHATVGEVTIAVLAPHTTTAAQAAVSQAGAPSSAEDYGGTDLNDASVVTFASVRGVTVLGLGDLEHQGQLALSQAIDPLVVDVVKVPHHGSDKQEPALAQRVMARVAIVSVGENSYGHPAAGALDLWGARASTVARTDECGDVVITPGPSLATSCPLNVAG